ncbi:MAG: hypothetical protein ABL955_02355 [Elusimicrobiota bacterium]
MSDNQPAPRATSKISLLLPCVSLVLTLAAFGLDAPAWLAQHTPRPAALLAGLEFDESIRYEPALSADQSDVRLVGARRVLDSILSRQLIAFR